MELLVEISRQRRLALSFSLSLSLSRAREISRIVAYLESLMIRANFNPRAPQHEIGADSFPRRKSRQRYISPLERTALQAVPRGSILLDTHAFACFSNKPPFASQRSKLALRTVEWYNI